MLLLADVVVDEVGVVVVVVGVVDVIGVYSIVASDVVLVGVVQDVDVVRVVVVVVVANVVVLATRDQTTSCTVWPRLCVLSSQLSSCVAWSRWKPMGGMAKKARLWRSLPRKRPGRQHKKCPKGGW